MRWILPLTLSLLMAGPGLMAAQKRNPKAPAVQPAKAKAQYSDYYGTMLTVDKKALNTGSMTFKWGITNEKPLEMAYFGAYLKPKGKFTRLKATLYADPDIKADLHFTIRAEKYNGTVLSTETLAPGETREIEVDIPGVQQVYIGTELKINHDKARRIIIGEPTFLR